MSVVMAPKGVPSPTAPSMAATFPSTHSMSCPIVMRDGNAFGFTTMSAGEGGRVREWRQTEVRFYAPGVMPVASSNGMSSSGTMQPTVPFCP